jgi:HemY protein
MRSALVLLLLLAVGVAAAFWLSDVGGGVEVRVGETWIGVSFPIALLLLAAAFLLLHALLSAIGALRRWPARVRARRAARRRVEGDAAVTRALAALAAGTGDAARLEVRRARAALGDTPQTLLLAAEAERLAGREGAAEDAFRALAQREDSRFLGLRGLLRAAMSRGDWDAALALAREAEAAQPGAAWLREERAQLALRTRDWREALALSPPEAPRAALALAAAEQEPDPARAAELERQAFQADPGFAPAALAHARRLREGGSARRARAVLEEAWARAPHPDLAAPYLAEEPDPLMRVKAAEALARHNPGHPESRLLMARTALDAGLTGRARTALEMLLRDRGGAGADRRAYLTLSEVEEAEHGETPEARAAQARWLREAATARPEPFWRCGNCGAAHAGWKPVCTACDAVGQIGWTTPVAAAAVPAPAPAARAATETAA